MKVINSMKAFGFMLIIMLTVSMKLNDLSGQYIMISAAGATILK